MPLGDQYLDEKTAARLAKRDRGQMTVNELFKIQDFPNNTTRFFIPEESVIGTGIGVQQKRWSSSKPISQSFSCATPR